MGLNMGNDDALDFLDDLLVKALEQGIDAGTRNKRGVEAHAWMSKIDRTGLTSYQKLRLKNVSELLLQNVFALQPTEREQELL